MGCPPKVQAALESVEGVEDVTVDYESKTAQFRVTRATEMSEIAAALEGAGFGWSKLD